MVEFWNLGVVFVKGMEGRWLDRRCETRSAEFQKEGRKKLRKDAFTHVDLFARKTGSIQRTLIVLPHVAPHTRCT